MEHKLGFLWLPVGVRTADNILPDCLSRWSEPGMADRFWSHLDSLGISDHSEIFVQQFMFDLDFRFRQLAHA